MKTHTTIKVPVETVEKLNKVKEHSGLPVLRITEVFIDFAYEAFLKKPEIVTTQIAKKIAENIKE
jgi:hypothetical protein